MTVTYCCSDLELVLVPLCDAHIQVGTFGKAMLGDGRRKRHLRASVPTAPHKPVDPEALMALLSRL